MEGFLKTKSIMEIIAIIIWGFGFLIISIAVLVAVSLNRKPFEGLIKSNINTQINHGEKLKIEQKN